MNKVTVTYRQTYDSKDLELTWVTFLTETNNDIEMLYSEDIRLQSTGFYLHISTCMQLIK